MDKENNKDPNETKVQAEKKEKFNLLYQYGGLQELDFDYYQGECPDINH